MTTQCLSCYSINSFYNGECDCSFRHYVWLCTTCTTNPVHAYDADCEPCEDRKIEQKVSIAENVPTEVKVSGITRLSVKFKVRVFKNKFNVEKKAKRQDRRARDNFRRIKMDYDTRLYLGDKKVNLIKGLTTSVSGK